MKLGPGEPEAGPWRTERFDTFVRSLEGRIVAVDGRGGSGKTTLAARIARAVPGAAVVHTDDVAWWHSRFGWADLMADGVLRPLREGRDVRYQPPAWAPRGRTGFIEVPAATPLVIVEGVAASRRELVPLIDTAIWVQSDYEQAKARGLRRDRAERGLDEADALREWDEWEAEEVPFFVADRPWERADYVVRSAVLDAETVELHLGPVRGAL
ncbi:uridine kinase family protein [Actinoplanes sp. URMC 104]|uniref:uridine kinase family protein n=1 Tax=Actinoplanes sp. URMC 104 TaxID=3423409 RepID=UPI003F1C1672